MEGESIGIIDMNTSNLQTMERKMINPNHQSKNINLNMGGRITLTKEDEEMINKKSEQLLLAKKEEEENRIPSSLSLFSTSHKSNSMNSEKMIATTPITNNRIPVHSIIKCDKDNSNFCNGKEIKVVEGSMVSSSLPNYSPSSTFNKNTNVFNSIAHRNIENIKFCKNTNVFTSLAPPALIAANVPLEMTKKKFNQKYSQFH